METGFAASPLEAMASAMNVPRPFIAWMTDQGLSTPEELAMVCSREADIETALIGASGVAFDRLIDRVTAWGPPSGDRRGRPVGA